MQKNKASLRCVSARSMRQRKSMLRDRQQLHAAAQTSHTVLRTRAAAVDPPEMQATNTGVRGTPGRKRSRENGVDAGCPTLHLCSS
jgi:hypothetical protein